VNHINISGAKIRLPIVSWDWFVVFLGLKSRKRNFVALQAYFDESGDTKKGQTTLILGGYISTTDRWLKLSKEWDDLITSEGGSGHLEIRRTDTSKSKRRCQKYYEIIEKYVDASVFCVVNVKELREAINDYSWPDSISHLGDLKHHISNPYHFAFKNLVRGLVENQEGLGLYEPIDMIFDDRSEKRLVTDAYCYLEFSAPDKIKEKLKSTPAFKNDKDYPALQAADLYVRLLRQSHLDGVDLKSVHPYSWPVNRHINTLYTYLEYDYFISEFNDYSSQQNQNNLKEYWSCR
jgi:hypothetical protein